MRAAPKVMPPILLCQPMTSETDVYSVTVEVTLYSHQYPITFCYCVTDCRKEAWQNEVWHGNTNEAKAWNWIPPWEKKKYPSIFINICWTFRETREWMWTQWGCGWCISAVTTLSPLLVADFYEYGMQTHVHSWQNHRANGGDYVEKQCFVAERLLYQIVLLYSLY